MSIRQERVAKEIQRSLGRILDRMSSRILSGVMVTVMDVEVSADLGVAKVYLGFLNSKNKQESLETVEFHTAEIRREFAASEGRTMKKVPEFRFYLDDTIDKIEKIEKLLKNIK